MLDLNIELDEITSESTALAGARHRARCLTQHWQTTTTGAHFAVLPALVDATAGTMAVLVDEVGEVQLLVGHLAPYDRSARHGAARVTMETMGMSVDIGRSVIAGAVEQPCRGTDTHYGIVVVWERPAAVRADLAETVRWMPLDELTQSPDPVLAATAALALAAAQSGSVRRSVTLR